MNTIPTHLANQTHDITEPAEPDAASMLAVVQNRYGTADALELARSPSQRSATTMFSSELPPPASTGGLAPDDGTAVPHPVGLRLRPP